MTRTVFVKSEPTDERACDALGDMSAEEFRRYGHEVIDWIAEYLEHPERYPVLAQVAPGEIKAALPAAPPTAPEAMDAILSDFERTIMPGITHWNHPAFFAYFSISGSGPGILGELLTAALNVNGMLWKTSPSATELEERVTDWLRQMLHLPEPFQGIILDTASISTMTALAAARERLALDVRERGMAGRADLPRLRVYTSEQAHSSVEKGAITLGIGQENVRKIAVDAQWRMDAEALERAIAQDIAAGYVPVCVVATVGTTSTTSIDPVPEIATICTRHNVWLHVDGAYGGIPAVVPELRHVLEGCERADSIVVNPHKWLFTPIDCSVLYVRDPATLRRAFSLVPEYLRTGVEDVTNYMDWGVQLGRRFRALKLWMVIRYFGSEGLAARLRQQIEMAQRFARRVDDAPHFERLAPVHYSTICFRAHPAGVDDEEVLERINAEVLDTVNRSGAAFISHTKLDDRYTLRLAIGNIRTTETHVETAWNAITEAADAALARRGFVSGRGD
jgi:aromatic-L-amino-acid/L-tryptophan decarboxylase